MTCPIETCPKNQQGFNITMQAQVDVAIVMTAMKLAYKGELGSMTLVAGDGDFRDLLEFVCDDMQKDVFMFAWKQSLPKALRKFTY